jgi:hypothetical protein
MIRQGRVAALLLLLGVVATAKLGQSLYRWYAYAGERAQLQVIRAELESVGVEVVRTQLAADSLRARIERMDRELSAAKRAVRGYDLHARDGALPARLYARYRRELDAYNRRVVERNASLDAWSRVVERNHAAVTRFNRLADSIRSIAVGIGEPYFAIPTPAEAALRRGIAPPPP